VETSRAPHRSRTRCRLRSGAECRTGGVPFAALPVLQEEGDQPGGELVVVRTTERPVQVGQHEPLQLLANVTFAGKIEH
jgi:hypothetical protein